VQDYWLGLWDESVAAISPIGDNDPAITYYGMREPPAVAMLLHGVAALIAARRGDVVVALTHLDAADARLPATSAERESADFLMVARAVLAEQEGRPGEALSLMRPLYQPAYAPMMLTHQWLPDVVRLALSIGDIAVADTATALCQAEADREVVSARAFAAATRVRALRTGDPQPALVAAAHYRAVGRRTELAAALEDAAVLLAAAGRHADAEGSLTEALYLYEDLGARWDLRRARSRFDSSRPSGNG
jgi:hypothetical protein